MSHLSKFLETAEVRQAELAATLGISRGYMSELVSGVKSPSRILAVKIERATKGAVSVSSWDHNSLDANAFLARQARPAEKSNRVKREPSA